ncbi:MAG TPA: galactokinase [Planctomycetota bacterium]|nr:galactokinase [Planctomycetota bacterium]
MTPEEELAVRRFREVYGAEPAIVARAPGRLEILGNHTDYNDGFILSAALELAIAAAADRSIEAPSRALLWSEALEPGSKPIERVIDGTETPSSTWTDYPVGVLREARKRGVDPGRLRLAFATSLPMGAGVSSSAALELTTAEAAFELAGGRPSDPMEVAKLAQRAEVEFVGVPCGLLDQFSSVFGAKDHVLFLDCRTLEWDRVPLNAPGRPDVRLVIADTGTKHALADGKYRELRARCEAAAERLSTLLGRPVPKLRDVTLDEFLSVAADIDSDDRRRAEHVIRENDRVLRGRRALREGRVDELGRLMLDSHASSRDLFGNSTGELDFLVDAASSLSGFIGAKLSGGGFGGATAHLVEAARAEAFVAELDRRWRARFGRPLAAWITRPGDGSRARRLDASA